MKTGGAPVEPVWRPSRRNLNTATLAAAFAALLSVGIFVILGMLAGQTYREQITRAEDTARSTARVVSVHTQWLVEASVQSLERIYDRLEAGDFLAETEAETQRDISSDFDHLPGDVAIAVFDPQGAPRLSSTPDAPPGAISDTAYFEALSEGQHLQITPMLVIDDEDTQGFIIARRLERDGDFAGIATVSIDNLMLADFAMSMGLGPESTLSLVRDDGWLVGRYPAPEAATNLIAYELFTEHLVEDPIEGTYMAEASPIDGVSRAVAYRAVPGLPLVAVSAISTQAILDRFWYDMTIILGLLVPIGIMLLVVAYMLWRAARRDQRTQERLGLALEKNQLLFREIHHRVKNNLQAVSSLIQMQPIPDEAKREMGRRIASMVAVHEHVYRTDQFERTEVSEYIGRLVGDIAKTFSADIALELDIEPVVVHRDHAMPLGLIVNEVLSNAYKYAFAPDRPGTISVSLKPVDDKTARLVIADDGSGFDPDAPSTGIGQRLIRGLSQQIGGKAQTSGETGTRFELVFPLEPPLEDDEDAGF